MSNVPPLLSDTKVAAKTESDTTATTTTTTNSSSASGRGHPFSSKEKNCRSCVDFKTWMKQASQPVGTADASPAKTESVVASAEPANHSCPLDINELGRNTWSFLHTMAANYPEQPAPQDKDRMKNFMSSFSYVYPCEMCAHDFRRRMKKEPVEVNSQHDLSQWMCRMHNQISKMLGKKTFDCAKVDERWRDGWADGSCG